jgi:hypothetical protein
MKLALGTITIISFLIFDGSRTAAQTIDRKSFEAKLYQIEPISHFGIDEQRFATLTETQKQEVIDARRDLIDMLRAIQMKRNALTYVTTDMAKKYRSSSALASSLLEPETTILGAGISDFTFVDAQTVKLHFFVAAFSEGNIVISEKFAVVKKTEGAWRVDGFE